MLRLDGAQRPSINFKGTILKSLATNVVDRAMLHAHRGNSGKGGRSHPEEMLLSSCVQLSTGCRSLRVP